MAVFVSFNSMRYFSSTGPIDALSIASLGQANTACSKTPYTGEMTMQLLFECSEDYFVTNVLSAGVIPLDFNSPDGF